MRRTLKEILAEEHGNYEETGSGLEKQQERAFDAIKNAQSFMVLFMNEDHMGGAVCCVAKKDVPSMAMNTIETLKRMQEDNYGSRDEEHDARPDEGY